MGIHRWPVNSPHKGPVTWKMFPFDETIMNRVCEMAAILSRGWKVNVAADGKIWHLINAIYRIGFCFTSMNNVFHSAMITAEKKSMTNSLRWRHSGRDGVSNHQPHHCLLNRLFRRRSKKTSKLRVTELGVGNSPVTGEFPAQIASNAENVSFWWRHHASEYCIWHTSICWKNCEFIDAE